MMPVNKRERGHTQRLSEPPHAGFKESKLAVPSEHPEGLVHMIVGVKDAAVSWFEGLGGAEGTRRGTCH